MVYIKDIDEVEAAEKRVPQQLTSLLTSSEVKNEISR